MLTAMYVSPIIHHRYQCVYLRAIDRPDASCQFPSIHMYIIVYGYLSLQLSVEPPLNSATLATQTNIYANVPTKNST